MKNYLTTILLILILPLLAWESVQACSCLPYLSPSQELERVDAVFTGVVVSIEEIGRSNRVLIDTNRIWKGPRNQTISVLTPFSQASCGYPFLVNEEVLVYAMVDVDTGRFRTHQCVRTRPTQFADEDLRELGEAFASGSANNLEVYPNPLSQLSVISFQLQESQVVTIELFDINGKMVKNIVDGEFDIGSYQFDLDQSGLPPGTYVVRLLSESNDATKLVTVSF